MVLGSSEKSLEEVTLLYDTDIGKRTTAGMGPQIFRKVTRRVYYLITLFERWTSL